MIKFAYTILYVQNVQKTASFYEQAFDFKKKFITPENDYAELVTGDTTLSFASIELGKQNLDNGFIQTAIKDKPFGIEIAFTTDDVEATVQKAISSGAKLLQKAKVKPWGQTVAYIRDLDGFLIEICSVMPT
jgi:lactoylglutathione lyase